MRRRRYLSVMLAVLLAGLLSGCGSTSTVTSVTVSPSVTSVILGGSVQFSASVSGPSDTTVSWSVSGAGCSGTACGTIDSNGLYTAPAQLFSTTSSTTASSSTSSAGPNTVTITATSNADSKATGTATLTLDSGIRVQLSPTTATLAAGDQYNFTATVTGTTNTQVTWDVNGTPNGNTTLGQVCAVGSNSCQAPSSSANTVTFLAPASVLGTTQVTLSADSVADTTRSASVSITIMPPVTPAIASISPPATAQGAVMQELYVNSVSTSNFFSTSTVLVNGQAVPTVFLSTSLLRAQVPGSLLEAGPKVKVVVEDQNSAVGTSTAFNLLVNPVRPSIISFSPVSVPQTQCGSTSPCGPASVTLDGGYLSPSTQVSFNGTAVGATLNSPNQIAVSLPGTALSTAGLYQLTLTNPGAAQPEAAVNVAVQPTASSPQVLKSEGVGQQPSAVAIDSATGVAVVANSGSNNISIFNLPSCIANTACSVTTVGVGQDPTGVAIDPLRNVAIVVNQGGNSLSIVNLSTHSVGNFSLPSNYTPVSIGENPLTGHALVANQETNTVTVVDLSQQAPVTVTSMTSVDVTEGGTRPGGTGLNPRVVVEPRLDWAIVTPGGAGAISAIDLSHQVISPVTAQPTYNVVFSFTLSTTMTGIALNPITDQLLMTDPVSSFATIFSLLDESVSSVTNTNNTNNAVGYDNVASAVNPLTNVGLLVGKTSDSIQLVDMLNAQVIGSPVTVGTNPTDVAVDDVTDDAVVVNQGSGNVSLVSMGTIRSLAVTQASVSQLFTSSASQQITLIGGGFNSGASVRIDGTALAPSDVQLTSDRLINVTIPASFLTGPRILNLDAENTNSTISNVYQIPVIQAVPVGTAPVGVAIDPASNLAVVTNSGSATASLVDLSAGAVTATVDVGSDPIGVGVFSREGQAVVANSGDDTASLIDLCTAASSNYSASCTPSVTSAKVSSTTGTVQEPVAVDIDPDLGVAAIANEQGNTVSFMNALSGLVYSQLAVDEGPLAVAIDPNIEYAGVLCSTQSPATIDIADLQGGITTTPAVLTGHITGANLPTGIALDPVNDVFLITDSTGNRVLIVDPQSNKITQNVGTGINPTSIAYNYNSLEAVTVNQESGTASVIEVTPNGSQVRSLMLVGGSSQQSVAINPLTNVAVVADEAHNRVLLVPLAH